ncbi:MAG: hypothetical protein C4523_11810 [Myxococcales bacterium]|nr:MAG: hypothetical protein C4523_11810 [Myxococcales bacterium]
MKRSNEWWRIGLFMFAVLAISMAGCSSEGDEESDGDSDGDVVPADVKDYAAGETMDLSFAEGSEEYRVVAYWAAEEESTTGYTLSTTAAEGADEPAARLRGGSKFAQQKPAYLSDARYRRMLRRLDWDRKLRADEKRIIEEGLVTAEDLRLAKRPKLSSECGENELARGADCLSEFDLKFMDFEGGLTDLTVAVRGKGEHVSVVVDTEDTDSVSQEDVDAIVENYDNVIYPRDHFLYGASVFEDLDYTDRDQDGLHMIVLSHLVNDSGAVGLFNPADFLGQNQSGATNTSDILWVVVPDAENSLDSVYGTVAHEYFHMIMFGVKGLKFSKSETLYLNESLAHLAEDASGFGIDNIDVVAAYLGNTEYSWAFSGDDVEARGIGFLFMRYLFEQQGAVEYGESSGSDLTDKGGAEFLQLMIATDKVGFEAVTGALGEDWSAQFGNFLAAVSLDDLEIANDPKYRYGALYDDPITGQQIGVCTNCTRANGAGDSLELAGLAYEDYSDGYEGLVTATGASVVGVTGDADTAIVGTPEDETAGLRFLVVRVK